MSSDVQRFFHRASDPNEARRVASVLASDLKRPFRISDRSGGLLDMSKLWHQVEGSGYWQKYFEAMKPPWRGVAPAAAVTATESRVGRVECDRVSSPPHLFWGSFWRVSYGLVAVLLGSSNSVLYLFDLTGMFA